MTSGGINALAESFNGHYKTVLNHRKEPWRNVEHVEWATLNYVERFNNERRHGEIGMVSPAMIEAPFSCQKSLVQETS